MYKWNSVDEVHKHALKAVDKQIKDIVKEDSVQKYYAQPKNKGWIGNAIESDWFGIPNNTRNEADIPNLNLEIKVTPIIKTRNGWSAKERLVLNIFNFFDEYKRDFKNASFLEKANLIEMLYYEHLKDIPSPEYFIKAATLFNLHRLPKEDMKIIEQDWNIIIEKIKEGKAEELSDSLTKYLGATTKGAKTEKNMTAQPFSNQKAHRRAFTLKGAYMSQVARRILGDKEKDEKIIQNDAQLEEKSFEEIVLEQFQPFIGQSKVELAEHFGVDIPKRNDKASSAILARKMLNLEGDIENTEEFKKAGISVKIITVNSGSERTTEGFKLTIPDNTNLDPNEIVAESWEESTLREYLSSYQFLLVVYENTEIGTIFKGAKFWRIPYEDLETEVKDTWKKTKKIFEEGVTLTYKKYTKPTSTGRTYYVENNLPGASSGAILHVRPSARQACYNNDKQLAMQLPSKSIWIDRPEELSHSELTDYFMTKQAWWLNPTYMFSQVKNLFK